MVDGEKTLAISKERYQSIARSIELWATSQANPDFFEVLDIGFRVAGTGSLGLDRYLILVTGKGSPDQNYLLDFKQQLGSSLQPYIIIERDLIAFGNRLDWQREVSIYTSIYAQQVQRDYRDFCQATQDLSLV
jgi:Uncharacterized protein conserved in bacteria (DUF2252)